MEIKIWYENTQHFCNKLVISIFGAVFLHKWHSLKIRGNFFSRGPPPVLKKSTPLCLKKKWTPSHGLEELAHLCLQRREEKKRRSRLRLRQLHITVSSKLNSMVVGDGVRTLIRFNCKFNHLFFFYSALQCIIRSVIL